MIANVISKSLKIILRFITQIQRYVMFMEYLDETFKLQKSLSDSSQ